MNTQVNKKDTSKTESGTKNANDTSTKTSSTFQFVDNRQDSTAQRKSDADDTTETQSSTAQLNASNSTEASGQTVQRQENNTGLPDNLKSGIENLSGYSMDDVRVHYNSDKPAQLQAHAYAQGTDIHVASGQEKHLAHEAWHVVQQKQGRVQPTKQLKGKVNVNDDTGLEREADVMGAKAEAFGGEDASNETLQRVPSFSHVIQPKMGMEIELKVFIDEWGRAIPEKRKFGKYKSLGLDVDESNIGDAQQPAPDGWYNGWHAGKYQYSQYANVWQEDPPIGATYKNYASIIEVVTKPYEVEKPEGQKDFIKAVDESAELSEKLKATIGNRKPASQIAGLTPTRPDNQPSVGHDTASQETTGSVQVTVGLDIAQIGTFIEHMMGLHAPTSDQDPDDPTTWTEDRTFHDRSIPFGMKMHSDMSGKVKDNSGGYGPFTTDSNNIINSPFSTSTLDKEGDRFAQPQQGHMAKYQLLAATANGRSLAARIPSLVFGDELEDGWGTDQAPDTRYEEQQVDDESWTENDTPDTRYRLTEVLQDGWYEYLDDNSGNNFYWNPTTDEKQWEKPSKMVYKGPNDDIQDELPRRKYYSKDGQENTFVKPTKTIYVNQDGNVLDARPTATYYHKVGEDSTWDAPYKRKPFEGKLKRLEGLFILMCQYLRLGKVFYIEDVNPETGVPTGQLRKCLDKNMVALMSRTDLSDIYKELTNDTEKDFLSKPGAKILVRSQLLSLTGRSASSALRNKPDQSVGASSNNISCGDFIDNVFNKDKDGVTRKFGALEATGGVMGPESISPWEKKTTDDNYAPPNTDYYQNMKTNVTQWDKPEDKKGFVMEMRNLIPFTSEERDRFNPKEIKKMAVYIGTITSMLNLRDSEETDMLEAYGPEGYKKQLGKFGL